MRVKIVIELIGGPMDGHRINIIYDDDSHDVIDVTRVQVVMDEVTVRIPGSIKIPTVNSGQSLTRPNFEYYWPRPCTLVKGKGTDEKPLPYYHSTYKERT